MNQQLQTVLDALQMCIPADLKECEEAIAIIKSMMQAEPVGYTDGGGRAWAIKWSGSLPPHLTLYAAPQAVPAYGPLTDKALLQLWNYEATKSGYNDHELPARYARVVLQQYAAAPQAVPAWYPTQESIKALKRFEETCMDSEGYDVSKEVMRQLAMIGLVYHASAGRYGITDFGNSVLSAAPAVKEQT